MNLKFKQKEPQLAIECQSQSQKDLFDQHPCKNSVCKGAFLIKKMSHVTASVMLNMFKRRAIVTITRNPECIRPFPSYNDGCYIM